MTFHWRGFLVFAAFAAVLSIAVEPGLGLLALIAYRHCRGTSLGRCCWVWPTA